MDLKALIREIPDFPRPGVSFKDITTLMKDRAALAYVVRSLADHFRGAGIQTVVGVESRGYVLGAPLAYELGTGFVLIRKPGKLPAATIRVEYDLEYGKDALEIHRDALQRGERVLLVDDLLATGGTMSAAARLVRELEAETVGFGFLIELTFLGGRERLKSMGFSDSQIVTLVRYDA
ncbi:MAG: adenine phosphoribosyltransferase [Limnochordaceae bacterium]|uniref:Adenine phosphoribosyltransferase n=1 Tax=Carboxydichorda subterranea TaxID=3109565 RepID=A0ABZ1BZR6_9FIRM|nr:adenine phosphoribosyltransferase [Limnochorda sp. L945t]MBE3598178.1 adenine phosphoribosyltransferase [Limnochordaceae bacterium]WRP18297.1 adenine phosphoribosyltransferase [Limnochorda sp. L945t]